MPVDIRLTPKLIANTMISGAKMITQASMPPPKKICCAMPDQANR